MPTGSPFFGRAAEQNELKERLVEERCRIVAILSSGGMGKTSLAAEVVPTIADHFDRVIWRSLLNAPPLGELLETLQPAVAAHELGGAPKNVAQQLQVLFYALREQRVLLVLDNLESILQADAPGYYRTGYTDYEQLLHGMATRQHRGQLLLTSREQPSHLRQLERDMAHVRMLQLQGLDEVAGEELLVSRGLTGGTGNEAALTTRYSGNPLALKLVADAVQDLFLGDVQEFLGEEALVFDDIRTVLEQQFARATDIEQEILLWLAVEREPLTVAEIHHRLLDSPPRRMVLEALRNLQRRSLTERTETGFGLQNVITEFLTDRLVEEAIQELSSKKLAWLRHHALLNAGAKEYVRESQVRLLLRPIAKHIHAKGPSHHLQNQIRHLLDELRNEESNRPGYAAGNLLNLLIHSARLDGEEELSAYDFSDLAIKQAFLRGATLHGFNFSGAQFADTVFTETFGAVLCLAVQPHGNLMAAGTFLGPIYLWRTDNLSSVAVIPWHQELVLGITFSTDGTKLASACADGTVGIWELSTIIDKDGAPLSNAPVSPSQTLKGHKGWVQAVAFSPDGQTIASGGVDQTVRLWDSSTGQQRHQFRKGAGRIYSVSFSPDGATLACGSEDRKIHLWDVQSGTEQSALTYETESSAGTFGVHAICFSPNGQILASCSPENTIWLWQLPLRPGGRAKASQICRGHSDWISDIAFNPDGDTLASASFDGTVRLWNVATGEASMVLFGHTNQPNAVAFTADGHSLVSGGADETIRFWDITSGHSNRILQGHTNHSADVAFSPDGEVFATANADNVVRLWECNLPGTNHLTDEAEFPAQRVLRGHKDNVLAVRFHPNGQLLASGGHDHTIYLWDRQTARPIRKLLGHSNCVRALAFSPNGETLVSGSYDLTARLWDVESGMVQHILHGHKDWILSVAISPDGELLATASDTVRLWDMASGNLVHTIPSQASMVYDVTFSPDGKMLVAGYLNQAVCVWDVASGKMLDDLYGHTGFVNFVAFSPDGQTLLSGDAGHWLYLWQADSQNQPQPLPHISISAIKYAFSPDSQLLVTGGDETIKIWQMPTGECIKTLHIPGPYERMDIRGATGLTEAQKATLKALGAIEGQ